MSINMTLERARNAGRPIRLGLRENAAQFSLLVVVNAFVGAMVGMERSILPAIAQGDFHLVARSAVLSFIVVFGLTKAVTNYLAGRWADRFGRKPILVISQLGTFAGFILLGFANTLWLLFVSRIIDGLSGANISPERFASIVRNH